MLEQYLTQDVYSIDEAVKILKTRKRTLLLAITRGHLRAYKLGRQFTITRDDLAQWVRASLVTVGGGQ